MAVTQVVELTKGRTCQFDEHGRRPSRTFAVVVSSPLDGPYTVANATGIPAFGDTYASGNDSDDMAYLRTKTPELVDPMALVWEVRCEYDTLNHMAGLPLNSSGWQAWIENPLARPVTRVHGQIKVQEAMLFEPPTLNPNGTITKGAKILNSAGQAYDPPAMRQRTINVVTFYKNSATFNEASISYYQDTINSDDFFGVPPTCALMNSVTPEKMFESGVDYVRSAWEVHFDFYGWDANILDQGLGTLDVTKNAPVLAKDPNGSAYTFPVLLNGQGQILNPNTGDPVYRTHKRYKRVPFLDIGIWAP
jgi:hypothetical protein